MTHEKTDLFRKSVNKTWKIMIEKSKYDKIEKKQRIANFDSMIKRKKAVK